MGWRVERSGPAGRTLRTADLISLPMPQPSPVAPTDLWFAPDIWDSERSLAKGEQAGIRAYVAGASRSRAQADERTVRCPDSASTLAA